MTLIKNLLLVLIGFSGATFVAAGTFAFIAMLGIIPRFAARTGTAKYILFYENLIILGGVLGNIVDIYSVPLFGKVIFLGLFGLFSGIFVGCLAIALAEVLQAIPIFAKRIKLMTGMPIIVLAMAFGKALGSLYQLVLKPLLFKTPW